MFVEGFNPGAALAVTHCPRCRNPGLVEIDGDTYQDASTQDRHQAQHIISPSIYCRCPSCNLVAEWPGCRKDDPQNS